MSCNSRTIVERWFEEVWNLRRTETIEELLTSESVCYTDNGPIRGPDEFKQRQHTPFLLAFPDLRVDVDAIITQGDQAVVRWTAIGTHSGDALGVPATHRAVRFRGITWLHVDDGKLAYGWQSSNIAEVLRGLGCSAPKPDVPISAR